MSAYIELHVVGGGTAIVEAGSIAGVLTAAGCGIRDPGTPDKPVRVLLRGGETLDVIGEFAGKILARAHAAKLSAKQRKEEAGGDASWEFWVDYLTPMGDQGGTDQS